MAAIAQAEPRAFGDRRRYQQEVERLLDQIGRVTQQLRFLKLGGARSQALAELKQDLRRAHERLAVLTTRP